MIEVAGDIWQYAATHWICIPTNLGYRLTGENIMGRGLAQQAAGKFPSIAAIYGRWLRTNPGLSHVFPIKLEQAWLLMFPTKPLNRTVPHLSWKSPSSIDLIKSATMSLANLCQDGLFDGRPVAIPAVGCGLGGLRLSEVLSVLHDGLPDDKFMFVHEPAQQVPF